MKFVRDANPCYYEPLCRSSPQAAQHNFDQLWVKLVLLLSVLDLHKYSKAGYYPLNRSTPLSTQDGSAMQVGHPLVLVPWAKMNAMVSGRDEAFIEVSVLACGASSI